jgi:hypothetical protein
MDMRLSDLSLWPKIGRAGGADHPRLVDGTYFTMRRTEAGFWAGYLNVKSGVTPDDLCGIGKHNFKEAVARLWLKLNTGPKS